MNFRCKSLLRTCFSTFIFIRSEWSLSGNMLMTVIAMSAYLDSLLGSVRRKKWASVSPSASSPVKKKNSLMPKKYTATKVNGMCGSGISMML